MSHNSTIENRDYVGFHRFREREAHEQRLKDMDELKRRIARLELAIAELIRQTERGAE